MQASNIKKVYIKRIVGVVGAGMTWISANAPAFPQREYKKREKAGDKNPDKLNLSRNISYK